MSAASTETISSDDGIHIKNNFLQEIST